MAQELFVIVAILPTVFWVWMIYECMRNDPEKSTWIWILIILNYVGAAIYFFARWLPSSSASIPLPNYVNRWLKRERLWNLEAEARNIGNAYQFVNLGNLQTELGLYIEAEESFAKALAKDPQDVHGIWGAAFLDMHNENYASAKDRLEKLLAIDPEYKFGDASLAYGKALVSLQDIEAAEAHLYKHVKSWAKPEAYYMLAKIKADKGEKEEARSLIDTMLHNLKGSPSYYYRRNQYLVRKANKLLGGLK
ncbi:Tetratricopeptide TPR_1 repeat-containing protein [Thalassoporum mexicanum PCC 7367]|uniref:PLDc N-terminal domain-containing protein n=1 Tax=Thalassoporum mexicanum TaxID=3457544 RepID=UPI00029FA4F1|nr:PLDc N-terminal domain-containing protein [Pseudanabaena sp. PCC 7367]AFY71138.1 Tetratricopeptide TPR_1 repeat-containing protein [Pseudanabaena sp. PCC 7367]